MIVELAGKGIRAELLVPRMIAFSCNLARRYFEYLSLFPSVLRADTGAKDLSSNSDSMTESSRSFGSKTKTELIFDRASIISQSTCQYGLDIGSSTAQRIRSGLSKTSMSGAGRFTFLSELWEEWESLESATFSPDLE